MSNSRHRAFGTLKRPLLFAHRGSSATHPENTMEAFARGLADGAHVLEMDVHLTACGEVVVMHDATVDRTTNGTGLVADYRYTDLTKLDAGHRFTPHGEPTNYPYRGQGCRIPRLSDVLREFAFTSTSVGVNIEIKCADPSLVRRVLDVVHTVGPPEGSVLLTAGRDAIMRLLEPVALALPLGMSKSQVLRCLLASCFGTIPKVLHGRAIQVPPRYKRMQVVTKRLINAAHRADCEVHVWTINDSKEAQRLLELGVDGIMTDAPEKLCHLF